MTSSASTFYVFVYLDGQAQAVPSGRLQMLEQGSAVLNSVFRYGDRYVERRRAIALDPFALALLGTQVQARTEQALLIFVVSLLLLSQVGDWQESWILSICKMLPTELMLGWMCLPAWR